VPGFVPAGERSGSAAVSGIFKKTDYSGSQDVPKNQQGLSVNIDTTQKFFPVFHRRVVSIKNNPAQAPRGGL
jgi:hypothetical protein